MENFDRELQDIKDWKEWHDTIPTDDQLLLSMYNEDYVISLGGKTISIPFNADTFDAIDQLIRMTIKEW